ncbi:MAG: nitrate reductase cytochrome c-type subunit [Steroidobacteraceae bacterium]|nr:nitrate reductase cytochrome c-type subunit [Steroidobacteraceae bacterium]
MRLRNLLPLCLLSCLALAQDPSAMAPAAPVREPQSIDALRRGIPLDQEAKPLPIPRIENFDLKRKRAYPDQPPTIPHSTDGYQIDKNSNRCLLCHSRANFDTFQAPMVSVTHFLDRDGQVLASVSPRRYFCTQCHVVQSDAKLLVPNDFRDVDELMSAEAAKKR